LSPRPRWLPQLIECSGEWRETLPRLYAVFENDFVLGRPSFRGKRVWWDRRVLPGEIYAEGFWHLISRTDHGSGHRIPEFRRAERLCWCRPMLDYADEPEVTTWDADASGKIRTYLWLEDEDFVLVLQQRDPTTVIVITAYHLDGEASRRKLRASYARRL
jgi:hypothetical protein